MSCNIDGLADKEEAGDAPTFHRLSRELGSGDAAGRDFGLGVSFAASGCDFPAMQTIFCFKEGCIVPCSRCVKGGPSISEALRENGETLRSLPESLKALLIAPFRGRPAHTSLVGEWSYGTDAPQAHC